MGKLYKCDPSKNVGCPKTLCGYCTLTPNIEFAVDSERLMALERAKKQTPLSKKCDNIELGNEEGTEERS